MPENDSEGKDSLEENIVLPNNFPPKTIFHFEDTLNDCTIKLFTH